MTLKNIKISSFILQYFSLLGIFRIRSFHSIGAFTHDCEGVGGLLTVFDTEESPLSTMQAPRLTSGAREGWLCFRNEPVRSRTMIPKGGDCHHWLRRVTAPEQVQTVPPNSMGEERVGC